MRGGAARSVEECDRKQARFQGGKISLGRKKSRESNCGDNTGDGGGAIGALIGSEKVFPGGDMGFCLVNKVMMEVVGWLLGGEGSWQGGDKALGKVVDLVKGGC
nr:hypothetical protein [Tanacetum cinerariifolium]